MRGTCSSPPRRAAASRSCRRERGSPPGVRAGPRSSALAERAYLRRLGASCNTPMAGHAVMEYAALRMTGVVASEDGRHVLRDGVTGSPEDAEAIGRWLAESLLAQGAAELTALHP